MHALMSNRIASEVVTLVYSAFTDSEDGSAVINNTYIISSASVAALQPNDIQRLEKAGIIVTGGVTMVFPEVTTAQPEYIIHGTKTYRVINWATMTEEDNTGVIATCDEMPIAGDDWYS